MLRGSVQALRVPPFLKNALKGKYSAIYRVCIRICARLNQ